MKSAKFLISLTIIGIILISFSGIGCRDTLKTNIRDIYNEFRSNFDSNDYEGMEAMLTDHAKSRIMQLGDDNFEAGFKAKLEKDKIFKTVMTIEGSDELDKILSGQMSHRPYAFEKEIRNAKAIATQVESLMKQLETANGTKKTNIQNEIATKTAEFKAKINGSFNQMGETFVKDAVRKAVNNNASADIITLKDAIEKALDETDIANIPNTGFIRFSVGADGNYRWEVRKNPDSDNWVINIP